MPSPLPPRWEGEGEGKSPAGGGRGRGGEMMAPTRHQETGPAVASPHAALSHSSGCDRDGGSKERGGEALKETAAAGTEGCHGLGPGEGRLSSWGARWPAVPWPAGVGGALSPQMGLTGFPPAFCKCHPTRVPQWLLGAQLQVPTPRRGWRVPGGGSRGRRCVLLSLQDCFEAWTGISPSAQVREWALGHL